MAIEILRNFRGIVGVAEVDDHLGNIGGRSLRTAQQGVDIFKGSFCLFPDITVMKDIALVIYARRAGDVDMSPVAEIEAGSAFESDSVFMGGVEVLRRLEICDLILM